MISVLHIRASNFYGGPEKQIVEHLVRLRPEEYAVAVASFDEGSENNLLSAASSVGIRTHTLSASSRIALRQIREVVSSESVDIVCAHGYKAAILIMLLKPWLTCKTIIFMRGRTQEGGKLHIFQSIEDRLSWFSDAVIAVSESEAKRLPKRPGWISPKAVHSVRNAVTSTTVDAETENRCRKDIFTEFNLDESTFLFVSAGRLSPEKGHSALVKAVEQTSRSVVDRSFAVLVCGDGQELQALEREAADLNVAHLIKFVGFRDDVKTFLMGMDCMILPSISEGLPNILLETMAFGKPSISTNVGGITELVEHGKQGIVVEPNSDSLAVAMTEVLAGVHNLGDMGLQASRHVRDNFSFESQTEILNQIYRSLLISSDS